jgi:hypothetical protein
LLSFRAKFAKTADVSTSHLLPKLFEGYEGNHEPIAVLDVGVGTPSTLEFFGQFRCRVFFLDLFEIEFGEHTDDDAYQAHAFETFSRVLGDYQGTLFDVCLFWDLLTRLDAPALRGLSDALRPYLFSESRGYAVSSLFADKRRGNFTYRIRDIDQLEMLPGEPSPLAYWSQCEFSERFDCFNILQDSLSADGRLEFIMEAD